MLFLNLKSWSKIVPLALSTLVVSNVCAAATEIPAACLFSPPMAKEGGAGGGNGGDIEEIALMKLPLMKVSRFIKNEGALAFPEVDGDAFATIARNVGLYLKDLPKDERLKDKNGTPRTCVWDDTACSITCHKSEYKDAMEQYPGAELVQMGHEVLGLMNLERGPETVPSQYPISSRLLDFVKEVTSYDLSTGADYMSSPLERGAHCYFESDAQSMGGLRKFPLITFDADGTATLWKVSEPWNWSFYHDQQGGNPKDPESKSFHRKAARQDLLGMIPKAEKVMTSTPLYEGEKGDRFIFQTKPMQKSRHGGYFSYQYELILGESVTKKRKVSDSRFMTVGNLFANGDSAKDKRQTLTCSTNSPIMDAFRNAQQYAERGRDQVKAEARKKLKELRKN